MGLKLKIEANFSPHVKLGEEWAKMSESVYQVQPGTQPLVYFWWEALRRLGELVFKNPIWVTCAILDLTGSGF